MWGPALPRPMTDGAGAIRLRYTVVCYHREPEKKCTLHPLRGRADVEFRSREEPGEFGPGALLLYPDGETLTPELARELPAGAGDGRVEIVLIDSRWSRAAKVLAELPPLRRVSLEGFVTGAERKRPPPAGGLASVEALYVASLMFGRPDLTLLDGYHFKERFLEHNGMRD